MHRDDVYVTIYRRTGNVALISMGCGKDLTDFEFGMIVGSRKLSTALSFFVGWGLQ